MHLTQLKKLTLSSFLMAIAASCFLLFRASTADAAPICSIIVPPLFPRPEKNGLWAYFFLLFYFCSKIFRDLYGKFDEISPVCVIDALPLWIWSCDRFWISVGCVIIHQHVRLSPSSVFLQLPERAFALLISSVSHLLPLAFIRQILPRIFTENSEKIPHISSLSIDLGDFTTGGSKDSSCNCLFAKIRFFIKSKSVPLPEKNRKN